MENLKNLLSKKTVKRDQAEPSMAGESNTDKRLSGWVQGFNCVYRNSSKKYPFRVAVETSSGRVRKNDVSDLPTAAYIANVLILAYDDRGKFQLNPFDGADAKEVNAWARSAEGKAACDVAGKTYAKQLLAGLQEIAREVERVPPEHVSERLATAKQKLYEVRAAFVLAEIENRKFGFVRRLALELDACVAELDEAFAEVKAVVRAAASVEEARLKKARMEAELLRVEDSRRHRLLEEEWREFMKTSKGDHEKNVALLVDKLGWTLEKGSKEAYAAAAEKAYFMEPKRYGFFGAKALKNLAENVFPRSWPHYRLAKLVLGTAEQAS